MSEVRPSNTQSLDPLLILSSTLQTAFEAVAGRAGIDPVIRPSEHADAQANGALGLAKELGQSPRQVAEAVLAQCGGNKSQACKLLGIGRGTLYKKLKEIEERGL